jgi:hypothetical protein
MQRGLLIEEDRNTGQDNIGNAYRWSHCMLASLKTAFAHLQGRQTRFLLAQNFTTIQMPFIFLKK